MFRSRAFVNPAHNKLKSYKNNNNNNNNTIQVIGDETCACIASWSNNVPMVAIRLPDKRRCREPLEPLNVPVVKSLSCLTWDRETAFSHPRTHRESEESDGLYS
jgi:hypothetical protein